MPSRGGSYRYSRWRRLRPRNRPEDPGRDYRRDTPDTPDRHRNSLPRPTWRPRLRADRAVRVSAVRIPRSRIRVQEAVAQSPNGGRRLTDHRRRRWWAAGSSFRIRSRWGTRTYKMPWTPAASTATTSSIRCRARRHPRQPRRLRERRDHRCIRSTQSTFPTSIKCTRYISKRRDTAERT